MRKLLFLFVALLATTCLWAQRFQVGDLYYQVTGTSSELPLVEPTEGAVTIVWNPVGFTPCADNQLVFAGDYNGYNTDPAAMAHFEAVEGANGWYVAVVTPADPAAYPVLQGKPCALAFDGSFPASWDHQWLNVEEGACEILDGSGDATIELEYEVESKLTVNENSSVVYIRSYGFKEDPCYVPETHTVTFTATAPALPEGVIVYVVGDFNGWAADATPMEFADGVWTATVEGVVMGDGYKYVVNASWAHEELAAAEEGADCGMGISNRQVNDVQMVDVVANFKDITIAKCDWYYYESPSKTTTSTRLTPNTVEVTYQYEWSSENYYDLTEANIPATIEYRGQTYDVVGISEGAFANSPITSVTIPNSIKTIGYGAFENCKNLTTTFHTGDLASWCEIDFEGWASNPMQYTHNLYLNIPGTTFAEEVKGDIVIPNTVDTIHSHAFMGATSFTSVTIPNSVTSIGDGAFESCCSLTSITIPNSVTSIGSDAFAGCSSLTSITIPNSVTSIGSYAFYGCSSLTSISIPNSVMSIGYVTFGECSSLTSITIPNSVTSIGDNAFSNCSSLEYLSIPNSVKFSEEYVYDEDDYTWTEYYDGFSCIVGCYNLKTLIVPADFFGVDLEDYYEGDYMEWFAYLPRQLESLTINGGNMTHPFGWDFMIQNRKSLKNIDFGATESIAEEAFNNFYNLESLVLPSHLETVPYMAMAECVKLKSISIPATVVEIEDRAFENCRMLSSVAFAENGALTRIGNWAFYNNHELTNLVIPEGVTEVGHAAFYGCTYLKEMTLPSTVQEIADNGFALCAKLQRMNVDALIPPTVATRTFEEVNRSIPVYVPDEVVPAYQAAPVWQEFNIQGKSNAPSALDNISSPISNNQKLLRDGQLLIIRDGKTYTIMGAEIH